MGGVKKAVKGVFKGVKKVVKGVAKGVKKVAKGVWKGVSKIAGAVGKVFGKLGPIGSLALGFVLPGIGNALSGLWSTTATSLAGSSTGWLSAVGKGMQWASSAASKAGGFISKGFSGITDKISSGLKWVGGKISDGANYLFQGAQKFMGVQNPASIQDVGKWVGEKAKGMFGIESKTATGMTKVSGGTLNIDGSLPTEGWSSLTPEQLSVRYPEAGGINLSGLDKLQPGSVVGLKDYATNASFTAADLLSQGPRTISPQGGQLGIQGPAPEFNYNLKSPQVSEGLIGPDVTVDNASLTKAAETYGKRGGLLDTAMKAGSSLLNAYANAPQAPQYVPYAFGTSQQADPYGSMRGGVGGQGASGGTFLSQAQLQQQRLLAQQLGQLG